MIAELQIFLILLCSLWTLAFARLMLLPLYVPALGKQNVAAPESWPFLSIIIPACNEAVHLESAVSTLSQQDYPAFEIILVNDRSTDTTGEIVDRLAAADSRIRPVHIHSLPAGWLGKVHALHQGVQLARGEWFLFTDADVHVAPATLRRALAFAVGQGADHLALVPRMVLHGFWLNVAARAFGLLFVLATHASRVNRSSRRAFVGIGAFNLVKAEAFHRTAGFEWLRLEPGDDVGLGLMIKQAGAVTRLAFALDELRVNWYESLPAMFKGLEKNLFGPGSGYRGWLVALQVLAIWTLLLVPPMALAAGMILGSLLVLTPALLAIGLHWIFALLYSESPADMLSALLFPIGVLLFTCMMIRAAYKCIRDDGIDWRGTHYPVEQLRAGQRVKLFPF
ncbi:MAG: glycosyltransferase [Deltaproteobacteria bacterium]|nr:glycosyltransferase [Deltaproteobacteria bacterium]